jgi:signal transduction histidine kinase/streptogramin lyase
VRIPVSNIELKRRLSKACSLLFLFWISSNILTHSQEFGFSGLLNPHQSSERSDYVIRSWGQADGLQRNGVYSIAQTPDGFLWLGTQTGIARFDGAHFKILSPYNTPGMPEGFIKSLYVDSKGRLWIGSLSGGMAVLKGNTVSEIGTAHVEAFGIHSFSEDRDGRIWFSSEGGLFFVDKNRAVSDPSRTGPVGTASKVTIDPITGGLYTCYWESVGVWQEDRLAPLSIEKSNEQIMSNHIYPRKDGGLWFLSANVNEYGALMRLVGSQEVTRGQVWPFKIPQYGIGAFLEDRSRNLWIAISHDAVYRVAPDGSFERFSIGNRMIAALFEDRDGSIWAGSPISGLTRLKKKLFQSYSAQVSGPIGTVSETPSGNIVFNKGTDTFSLRNGKVEPIGVPGRFGVLADLTGHIWTGEPGILARYRWNGSKTERIDHTIELPATRVRAFLESKNGEIWFGSSMAGLLKFEGQSFTALPETRDDAIFSLAEDVDGTIWAGTTRGHLWKVTDGKATRLEIGPQIDHRPIAAIYLDSDQVLWLGTMGKGLVFKKGDQFVAVRRADGLPSDEVCGIVEVGPHIWLATTGGIVRIPRDELYKRSIHSGPLSRRLVFGVDDGLLDSACSSDFSPSMHLAKDGKLWISMVENLVSVNPAQVSSFSTFPDIYIEEVRVNDQVVSVSEDQVRVQPSPARLSFAYTGVVLDAPERARFQYRLEGLDADWVDSWGQRTAHYTAPPPGFYRFSVRTANNRGEWSDKVATLAVTIEPHIWQTIPFKIASVALIVGVLGSMVWLTARAAFSQKLVKIERAHAVEKERSRIAREIHDQLGSHLTQIMFQSKTLTHRLLDGSSRQAVEHASKVEAGAQELAKGLDEVVWATNPEMDNLEGVVAYITSYAEEFFLHTDTRLRLDVPIQLDTREMAAESRHQLFLACREAMTNILKHARATETTVRMHSTEKMFSVEISDNGRGLVAEDTRRLGNGLLNIRERMHAIRGTAEFVSLKPKGLTVRLSVPMPFTSALSPKRGTPTEEDNRLG